VWEEEKESERRKDRVKEGENEFVSEREMYHNSGESIEATVMHTHTYEKLAEEHVYAFVYTRCMYQ